MQEHIDSRVVKTIRSLRSLRVDETSSTRTNTPFDPQIVEIISNREDLLPILE